MAKIWKPKRETLKSKRTVFSFVGIFAVVGATLLILSFAATPQKTTRNDDVSKLLSLNSQIEAMSRAVRWDGNRKSKVTKPLADISKQRKSILKKLIKSDPESARKLIFADDDLTLLTSIAGNSLEKKVTLSGIYYIKSQDGQPDTKTLYMKGGTEFALYTNGKFSDIPIESNVTVTGYQFDNTLFIPTYSKGKATVIINKTPKKHTVAALSATNSINSPVPKNVLASAQTVTNVAIIQINFTPFAPLDPNIIHASVNGTPGSDLVSYWQDASYGKEIINPTFLPVYNVSVNSCPLNSTAAFMAQYGNSIDWTQYQRYSMYFNCGIFSGAVMLPTPTGSILGSQLNSSVVAGGLQLLTVETDHELAHVSGLGNQHANYFDCQPSVFIPPTRYGENCVSVDYQNPFDILGSVNAGNFIASHEDAYHTNRSGWFEPANYPSLTTPGTYTYKLLPYETPTTGVLALNIPRGNSGTAFTLEYRQPIGFDSWMTASNLACTSKCTADKGPMLNFIFNAGVNTNGDTQLIDTTPLSNISSSIGTDTLDGMLLPGKSFTDPEYGIQITTVSADSTGATVQVTVPASATCVRNNPTVTLTSSSSQTVSPGQNANYTYSVKSNDSATCSPIKYKYAWPDDDFHNKAQNGNLTDAFSHTVSPDVFTLAPGATTSLTLTVSPNNSIRNSGSDNATNIITKGTWQESNVGSIASDSLATSPVILPGVSTIVSVPAETTAPTQPANLVAQVKGTGVVNINWSASTDNSGTVAGYIITMDNTRTFQTNQLSLILWDSQGFMLTGGIHNISVIALDQNNNASAIATTNFTIPAKTDTQAPKPPAIINMSATDRTVTVTWTSTTDNVGVFFYKVNIPFIGGATILPTPNTSTYSYTFTNLPTNHSTIVSVTAVDADGNFSAPEGTYFIPNSLSITTANAGTLPPTTPAWGYLVKSNGISMTVTWPPSTDDKGVAGYYIYKYSLRYATVTTNSFTDTALAAGSFPHYTVEAFDSDGNVSAQTGIQYYDLRAPYLQTDSTPPTNVVLTLPSNAASISGIMSLSATAQDNVGVAHITYWLDGRVIGNVSSSPYSAIWDTNQTYNGTHTLVAVASDIASNEAASSVSTITVNNGGTSPKPGDVNNDGTVNILDLSVVALHWNQTGQTLSTGDINGDGTVNILDLSILATNFGS